MTTTSDSSAKFGNTGPISRSKRLWLAAILGSLSAFGPLSLDMYLPALPQLAEDLNTTASYAQASLTACLVGLAAGQLLAGPISDMRGRRGPLLIGLILYAAASLLCVFAPSIITFLLLRFVQGLAGSAGIVISRAITRDLYSGPELTKFFSLLMLVNGAAPILAPIFGGQLLEYMSWRGVFGVLSGLGGLMLLGALFGLKETLPAQRRIEGGLKDLKTAFGTLLRDRTFMGYALTQGFVIGAMFAYISGSPFVIQDVFGVSPQGFSLIFAMNGLGIITAGQITGRIAGRVPEARLFAAGLAIAATGGALLLAAVLSGAGLPLVLATLFLVVSSVGIVSASGFPLAMSRYGHAAGTASALLGLLSYILGGVLAPFVGIAGRYSAMPMAVVIACAEACALLCYFLLVKRGRRENS
ncbi:multidrug effflux MFS transporter [Paenibacillus gansuensis]|uniref:Bcr/CflA family efflux transporter n=1 Tax=Paenibacillus gansuensis TaxID=306542 RepID=A0ABW5PI39_9BACL